MSADENFKLLAAALLVAVKDMPVHTAAKKVTELDAAIEAARDKAEV